MTMKIYASMGVLSHEKRPVYTVGGPAGEIYDELTVELPDGWELDENEAGEPLLTMPTGEVYLASDLLTNADDDPALRWYDGNEYHHIVLHQI